VPTDDVHLTQVNFHEHWLLIVRDIIQPIQQKAFTGYYSNVSRMIMETVSNAEF
jgi:hypothetical protein